MLSLAEFKPSAGRNCC